MAPASAIKNDTAFYLPENPTLSRLVEAAKTQANDDAEACKRIHRAAALVEAGAVRFDGQHCTVQSGDALYPVDRTCPCPDMVRRGLPCKHLYSKWLAIRLAQAEANMHDDIRSKRFVASWGDGAAQVHGIATVWEDGRILFREYDTETDIPCSISEVVLGGKID